MNSEIWDVQVLFGATEVSPMEGGNVKFGTPTVTLGDGEGGTSPVFVPLIYTNVAVRTVNRWACVETIQWQSGENVLGYGPGTMVSTNTIIREMDVVTGIHFQGDYIRIEGMESRADGALVIAVWEVTPSPVGQPGDTP